PFFHDQDKLKQKVHHQECDGDEQTSSFLSNGTIWTKNETYHPVFLRCSSGIEVIWEICRNLPSDHSISHEPGLPLRTFNNSTFQRGKPTPGTSSGSILGRGVIFQRVTQAVVLGER